MGATPPPFQIAELPPRRRDAASLWQAYRLRMQRRLLLARALRKRHELTRVQDRTGAIRKGDILAVVCLRNEPCACRSSWRITAGWAWRSSW